jgi:hypothetical protein
MVPKNHAVTSIVVIGIDVSRRYVLSQASQAREQTERLDEVDSSRLDSYGRVA